MTDENIKSLAAEIQISVKRLLQQFINAGIKKTEYDIVTKNEKEILLAYLNKKYINTDNQTIKLTLQRKIKSTLNIMSASGKNKSVNIEVRKKRTYTDFNILEKSNIEEQIKNKIKDFKKQEIVKKVINKVIKKNKIKQNDNNEEKVNFNKNIVTYNKKKYHEVDIVELKHKVEEEKRRKIEIENKRIIQESCYMVEENTNFWNNNIIEDNVDYHTTTFHHAREAEDENDVKEEFRHIKSRNNKTIKQRKNNKYSEKIDHEEKKIVIRASKNKSKQKKISLLQQKFTKPTAVINRNVIIGETITIADLANKMAVKSSQVIKVIMKMGMMVTINQVIDQVTAQLVAEEMGHKVFLRYENKLEQELLNDRDTGKEIGEFRAPVVTIMGHVDHGKTSLLDYIRSTTVAFNEAGGITQHIGAYHVKTDHGMITFLDTPGHSAFTSMRARGAKVTDIVVLVIAADDGVMPQTIEAIQHAKAANVPIIVAINKVDKYEANPDRIKKELSQHGVQSEDWGGETQFINISVKKGIGINKLLEAISLQAELLELKTIRTGMASGIVIESYLDKGRGSIATILVKEGTIKKGDIVLCGLEYGRIRAMRNELGKEIKFAGPSIPVEILGLSNIPSAGDKITVVRDEKKAREVALYRQNKVKEVKLAYQHKLKLENIFSNINNNKISELNIVLKTDVQGSCEAIIDSLQKISTSEVIVKIIGSGVGGITETDVTLASASNAIIIGFNVRADIIAKRIVENENLDLRYYSVIYNLIDEVKQAMSGMLTPEYKQKIIGLAEVRNIFKSPKFNVIAGCMITEGIIKRNNPIHVLRNNIVIYKGELESLRRFKDDINEARNGMECGIGIKNYNDMHIGDIIEVFEIIKIKRSISN